MTKINPQELEKRHFESVWFGYTFPSDEDKTKIELERERIKISREVLERLATKIEKASRKCPPQISGENTRFKRFITTINNYEDIMRKISDSLLIEISHWWNPYSDISERVYDIKSRYDLLKIQNARRELAVK
jgi:hypothetical protein